MIKLQSTPYTVEQFIETTELLTEVGSEKVPSINEVAMLIVKSTNAMLNVLPSFGTLYTAAKVLATQPEKYKFELELVVAMMNFGRSGTLADIKESPDDIDMNETPSFSLDFYHLSRDKNDLSSVISKLLTALENRATKPTTTSANSFASMLEALLGRPMPKDKSEVPLPHKHNCAECELKSYCTLPDAVDYRVAQTADIGNAATGTAESAPSAN